MLATAGCSPCVVTVFQPHTRQRSQSYSISRRQQAREDTARQWVKSRGGEATPGDLSTESVKIHWARSAKMQPTNVMQAEGTEGKSWGSDPEVKHRRSRHQSYWQRGRWSLGQQRKPDGCLRIWERQWGPHQTQVLLKGAGLCLSCGDIMEMLVKTLAVWRFDQDITQTFLNFLLKTLNLCK